MKHKYLKQNFLAETDSSDLTLAEVQKSMLRTKVDKREKKIAGYSLTAKKSRDQSPK
jgi:hypothetical protein